MSKALIKQIILDLLLDLLDYLCVCTDLRLNAFCLLVQMVVINRAMKIKTSNSLHKYTTTYQKSVVLNKIH